MLVFHFRCILASIRPWQQYYYYYYNFARLLQEGALDILGPLRRSVNCTQARLSASSVPCSTNYYWLDLETGLAVAQYSIYGGGLLSSADLLVGRYIFVLFIFYQAAIKMEVIFGISKMIYKNIMILNDLRILYYLKANFLGCNLSYRLSLLSQSSGTMSVPNIIVI